MSIGNVLLDKGLITHAQLDEASRRQRMAGGPLAESLVALGYLTQEQLESIYREPPFQPKSVEETGLDHHFLFNFVLRCVYMAGLETIPQTVDYVKLPYAVLEEIFEEAKQRRLIEVLGQAPNSPHVLRYAMTTAGKTRAMESMTQCQYAGPAPVPLKQYQAQVEKQSVGNERITDAELSSSFAHLVLPKEVRHALGPAIGSGKSMLLYGGVGNGKTSVAEAVGHAFRQPIYIPYALEIDSQIIKLFDAALHRPVPEDERPAGSNGSGLMRSDSETDPRWVLCRRPVVVTGGELTMEMLDLIFDEVSKFYEAPAHIKANGGVFVIDDFGRQRLRSVDLLNRWILPLESRVDFLTLHTGMKLRMPFDQLVVFSTNYQPDKLMDAAALRRIPYKILVEPPTPDDYKAIFRRVCDAHGLELPDAILERVVRELFSGNRKIRPAGYQPKFIIEHVLSRCRFEGVPAHLNEANVTEALDNLAVRDAVGSVEAPEQFFRPNA